MKKKPGTADRAEREKEKEKDKEKVERGKEKLGTLDRLARKGKGKSDSVVSQDMLSDAAGAAGPTGTPSVLPSPSFAKPSHWRPSPLPDVGAVAVDSLVSSALSLERTFVLQLDSMLEQYAAPLRKMARDRAGEIDNIFREVEGLRQASGAAVAELEAAQAAQTTPWLAPIFGGSYSDAYKRFLGVNKDSLVRIHALRNSADWSRALSDLAKASRFPTFELEDLMWAAVSRIRHLNTIAKAQRDFIIAADLSSRCIHNADRFATHSALNEDSRLLDMPLEILESIDAMLDRVASAAGEAVQIEMLYTSMMMLRNMDNSEIAPLSTGRKFIQQADFFLLPSTEFALTSELPVKFLLFTDGLAVAMPLPPGGRHPYKMIEWYDFATMHIAERAGPSDAKKTFLLANKSLSRKAEMPPGWTDSRGKYQYAAVPGSERDYAPLMYPVTGMRLFAVPAETTALWLKILRSKCSNASPNEDWAALPYAVTGVALERLMAHEEACHASHALPMVVRRIVYQITSLGMAEKNVLLAKWDEANVRDLEEAVNRSHAAERLEGGAAASDLAELLKRFLRALPQPVVPADVALRFLGAAGKDGDAQTYALFEAFEALPALSRPLLRRLLAFLSNVAANGHVNRTTPQRLAEEFAPLLLFGGTGAQPDAARRAQAAEVFTPLIARFIDLFETPGAPLFPVLADTDFITFRRRLYNHEKSIRAMAFVSTTKAIWSIDSKGVVGVWDAQKIALIESFQSAAPRGAVCCCAVEGAVWLGTDEGLVIYDAQSKAGTQIRGVPALSLAHAKARDEMWCGTMGAIVVFERASKQRVAELRDPDATAGDKTDTFALAIDPLGRVWSGGRRKGTDQEARNWLRSNKSDVF